ncbi:DUF3153 domain-containing protein [Saccharopolyspora rosea]|uniref:DUF3153 domain-containing protein n=1 Tax=Saccharopolyspora rosea TaxID=524884 RepID=A0ABW3FSI8_9PSEU|nr:DUF3153 domain-containing protein [Saccharopolyspora rosea]
MEGKTPSPARGALLLVVFAAISTLLGGCLHLNSSLNISGDDLVSGELLVTTQTPEGQAPFRLRAPDDLADRVRITPYSADGQSGSHLSFQDLSFQEVERLSQALSPSGSRYQLNLSRSGSLVTLNAQVDLTPLANTDSAVQVKVSAPGDITNTNGQESAGTVTWNLEPGEVTRLVATYQYSDASSMSWVGWALLLGVLVFGAAGAVGALALRSHVRNRADQRI